MGNTGSCSSVIAHACVFLDGVLSVPLNLCFLWPCALPDLFKVLEGPRAKSLALKESLESPPGGVALGLDLLSL